MPRSYESNLRVKCQCYYSVNHSAGVVLNELGDVLQSLRCISFNFTPPFNMASRSCQDNLSGQS